MEPAYYEALTVIEHNGVRAYNPGDHVPAENVQAHGYVIGEQVRAPGTPQEPENTAEPVATPEPAEPPTDESVAKPRRRS